MIKIREIKDKKDLKDFILLPYKIHKDHKEWLPPLISDEWKVFDKEKNHSFSKCDTIMLLAEEDNKLVGRIMGIINHTYNKGHREKNVRFCFAECYKDDKVYASLLQAIEKWGKDKGMTKIIGPLGFSDKDPQGYLIEGFNDPMSVMVTNCSFEYMVDFTVKQGYTKMLDLFQYRTQIPQEIPAFYESVANRVINHGFKLVEFTKTKDVRPYVKPVFDLINESYKDIYGFAALEDRESKEFSERFLPLLKPEYIKIVLDKDDKLVAFVIAMPDISQGFRKANGKLFPFGFIHILRSFRSANQLNLLLGSVKETIRNSGIDALLAVGLFKSAKKGQLEIMDSHLILEQNTKMRALMERLDSTIYKKYRIFQKEL